MMKTSSNVFIRRNGNLSSTLEHNLLHIKIRCRIRNCILKCNFMFISWPSFTYLHCMHQYDNIYIYWIELSHRYQIGISYTDYNHCDVVSWMQNTINDNNEDVLKHPPVINELTINSTWTTNIAISWSWTCVTLI